jgi:hypothetical protein
MALVAALVAVLIGCTTGVIPERIPLQWLRHAPVVLLVATALLDVAHAATSKAKVIARMSVLHVELDALPMPAGHLSCFVNNL